MRDESTEKDEGRRIILGVICDDLRDRAQERLELEGRMEE